MLGFSGGRLKAPVPDCCYLAVGSSVLSAHQPSLAQVLSSAVPFGPRDPSLGEAAAPLLADEEVGPSEGRSLLRVVVELACRPLFLNPVRCRQDAKRNAAAPGMSITSRAPVPRGSAVSGGGQGGPLEGGGF